MSNSRRPDISGFPCCDWTLSDDIQECTVRPTLPGDPPTRGPSGQRLAEQPTCPLGRSRPVPMSNIANLEISAHQPLSVDEVTTAVNRLGRETLHLPAPTAALRPPHEIGELPTMTAAQRFWLAFTGKPGSSGRAGPAYEPGLPRHPRPHSVDDHPVDDHPLGIPSQRKPTNE